MTIDVYLEVGTKRVFASALDWPGWSRSGRDRDAAVEQLLAYGPRYAKVVKGIDKLKVPSEIKELRVVEEVKGNSTTDFGAPGRPSEQDTKPVNASQLTFLSSILESCFAAFDSSARAARGKTLTKGPRGGGRDLDKIASHVQEANLSYLMSLAGREGLPPNFSEAQLRTAMLDAVAATARGELPTKGPRGGQRYTPRYFVRRAAWHILDHAWEIEDRAGPARVRGKDPFTD